MLFFGSSFRRRVKMAYLMLVEVTVHCLITPCIALLRMGHFWASHDRGRRWEGLKGTPCLKSDTHPTMMKLGTVVPNLKKIKKVYETRNAPLKFCWHRHFFTQNQQIFAISRNADILINNFRSWRYYILCVVMRPKFSNSSISVREVI